MSTERPLSDLFDRLGSASQPGRVLLIVASPGVGKTTLLTHLCLEVLQSERQVLHVALSDAVERVRTHYDEAFRASRNLSERDHSAALVGIERRRMVLSYAERPFDAEHLNARADMLADVAQLLPAVVAIDGLDASSLAGHGDALRQLAADRRVELWCTVTAEALPEGWQRVADVAVTLESSDSAVRLSLHDDAGEVALPWLLDPTSFGIVEDGGEAPAPAPGLVASDCTLYSGGAQGSEAAFGEAAARHGLREVHFTFEGHKQGRTVGARLLTPRELEAGDVSLVYVSRRLHRTYSEHGLIRRVLQTLWHMVSRAQQVFVIGAIQEDGTVVGGTGWSVELARMWNRDLWVFDQERKGWFTWDGKRWVAGTPVIRSAYLCGTGTRYLEASGQEAIDDLFARSFPG